MPLTTEQRRLASIVLEDLEFVKTHSSPTADAKSLRRLSVELRKLLIEGLLIRCWKDMGNERQPIIIAPKILVDDLPEGTVSIAAGGRIGGGQFANITFMPKALSAEQVEERMAKRTYEHPFPLSDFQESLALFVQGKKIKRRHVVAYVANKDGGAHLDTKRKKDDEAYLTLDAMKSGQIIFAGAGGQVASTLDPVYMSMLAIASR